VGDVLALILGTDQDWLPLPDRLCAECVRRLDVDGAGLILINDQDNLGIVAVTEGPAARIEELQFATGEGPCVDAARTGRPVLQPDLHDTAVARWPGFGVEVLTTDVRAIFAFPLQIGAIRIGVLDLCRDAPGHLTQAQLSDALTLAEAATLILLQLQDRPHGDGVHPMIDSVDNHAIVHQATGMIAIQLGVSLAESLLRLRAHAYASELSMAAIAADVVNRKTRFDDSEGGTSLPHEQ